MLQFVVIFKPPLTMELLLGLLIALKTSMYGYFFRDLHGLHRNIDTCLRQGSNIFAQNRKR